MAINSFLCPGWGVVGKEGKRGREWWGVEAFLTLHCTPHVSWLCLAITQSGTCVVSDFRRGKEGGSFTIAQSLTTQLCVFVVCVHTLTTRWLACA